MTWTIIDDRPDGDTSTMSFLGGTLVRERTFQEHPRGRGFGEHISGVAIVWIPCKKN